MNLRVSYNQDAFIGAIGPSAWAKLGPERWFTNYKMIIANARHFKKDYVINLDLPFHQTESYSTQSIVDNPAFLNAMQTLPGEYKFVVYRPIAVPEGISKSRFVCNDMKFSQYEDKRIFRTIFADRLPIPPHEIISMDTFLQTEAQELFETYIAAWGGGFVMQDNKWGGGIGTFIMKTAADVSAAQEVLAQERKGDWVVVSELIEGTELSVQVFVSQDRVVSGPLQQQLVRNKELQHPKGRGGMHFCGGRIVDESELSKETLHQVERIVSEAAKVLRSQGYSGIFGIDFLVGTDGRVYVLEINARTTGILPLLNEQQSEVPIYLLHILELAGQPYGIEGSTASVYRDSLGPRSFVILFNKSTRPAALDPTIQTGNYIFDGSKLHAIDSEARWNADADCMIQLFATKDFPAKPNVKLCNVFLKEAGFSSDGELTEYAQAIVDYLKKNIIEI